MGTTSILGSTADAKQQHAYDRVARAPLPHVPQKRKYQTIGAGEQRGQRLPPEPPSKTQWTHWLHLARDGRMRPCGCTAASTEFKKKMRKTAIYTSNQCTLGITCFAIGKPMPTAAPESSLLCELMLLPERAARSPANIEAGLYTCVLKQPPPQTRAHGQELDNNSDHRSYKGGEMPRCTHDQVLCSQQQETQRPCVKLLRQRLETVPAYVGSTFLARTCSTSKLAAGGVR